MLQLLAHTILAGPRKRYPLDPLYHLVYVFVCIHQTPAVHSLSNLLQSTSVFSVQVPIGMNEWYTFSCASPFGFIAFSYQPGRSYTLFQWLYTFYTFKMHIQTFHIYYLNFY